MIRITAIAFLCGITATATTAQELGEAQLFANSSYRGQSINLAGPATKLGGFVVKSIRLPVGASWDLCSGNTFTGCKRFTGSNPGMVFVARSARPASEPISANVEPGSAASQIVGKDGPTLRGYSSQFYVEPLRNGSRIDVNSKGGESDQAAGRQFCIAHGWRELAYARVQTLDGRSVLADVLCANVER